MENIKQNKIQADNLKQEKKHPPIQAQIKEIINYHEQMQFNFEHSFFHM
jgi:hypothetical protein